MTGACLYGLGVGPGLWIEGNDGVERRAGVVDGGDTGEVGVHQVGAAKAPFGHSGLRVGHRKFDHVHLTMKMI